MLEEDLTQITNQQLQQSIANITMLMDKINHTISNQEHLLTETDEYSRKERLRLNLPKPKHHKNKLSTVMEESINATQVTITPRQPLLQSKQTDENTEINNVRSFIKTKISISKLQPPIKTINSLKRKKPQQQNRIGQLVARKQITLEKPKKGLSICSKVSTQKPLKKIKTIEELSEKKKKTNLRDFYTSKRITLK